MKIGIYPGSFDPTTKGHMDIIERSAKLVDQLVVGVLHNIEKVSFLQIEERVELLKELTAHLDNVVIEPFSGLLVDFVKQKKAGIIIRSFRAISDFEYELQLAQTNHMLSPDVETVFLVAKSEYSFISSSMVKQLIHFGGDISKMVPEKTAQFIIERSSRS
ncbi:MAG: pantetheine-phosphate adenylyltransferase [Vallitaleaceae bacterium]|nr:pantetheine-phosphate adenylyltransferase [Vallitaleaceae bacterium]